MFGFFAGCLIISPPEVQALVVREAREFGRGSSKSTHEFGESKPKAERPDVIYADSGPFGANPGSLSEIDSGQGVKQAARVLWPFDGTQLSIYSTPVQFLLYGAVVFFALLIFLEPKMKVKLSNI